MIVIETETVELVPGADLMAVAHTLMAATTITTTTITTTTGRPIHTGRAHTVLLAQRLQVGHHGPAPAALRLTGRPTCTVAALGSALPKTETRSWTLKPADPAAAVVPVTPLLLTIPTLVASTLHDELLAKQPSE